MYAQGAQLGLWDDLEGRDGGEVGWRLGWEVGSRGRAWRYTYN